MTMRRFVSTWTQRRTLFPQIVIILIVTVLTVFGPSPAEAADYVLTTGTDYPPFADPNLPGGGLAVQIVKAAFAAVGKTIEIQTLPWTRGYDMVRAGRFDGTFPYIPTPERMDDMVASDAMFTLQARIWSSPDHVVKRFTETAMIGSRLCLPLGYAMPEGVQAMLDRQEITVTRPPSLMNCLTMIAGYHADFLVADAFILHAAERQVGVTLVAGEDVLQARALTVFAAKTAPKSAALIADFNKGLEKIRADDIYARLLQAADLH